MPRQFSEFDKAKWLKWHEGGETEKAIAKRARCDLRTVKKALEEARRRQDSVIARRELLKDALRKHQDSLLGKLDGILSGLELPPVDAAVLPWNHGDIRAQTVSERHTVSAPDDMVLRLLKQHLRHDRLWRALADSDKAVAASHAARIALQRKTADLLEERTGYKLVGQFDHFDLSTTYLWSSSIASLFYDVTLKDAFGINKGMDIQGNIIAHISIGAYDGELWHGAEPLAKANQEKTRDNLATAFRELRTTSEVAEVVSTYETLSAKTNSARRIVDQLKLLGIVPGQCEICRRLGM